MEKTKAKRDIGRRLNDRMIRRHVKRFESLFVLGQTITSEIRLNALFLLINEKTNQIMKSERSTVFLFDDAKNELWSFVATGMKENEIRIPADKGVAGWVFEHRESVIINDVYSDPRFYPQIDKTSGFKTRSLLCIPLMNKENRCIGVIQALNRRNGKFTKEDEVFLRAISDYVAIALENAKLYADIKTYANDLKKAVLMNESLTRLKQHLTKFVPPRVAALAEEAPDLLDRGKKPMAVSVLFVDVIGFSGITESHDQHLVNHMIETHFSSYLNAVQAFGGEINETSGDGVMVIFTADAGENHALSAVRAALDIISENRRLNREVDYPWGKVDLHLGVSSGEGHVGVTRMKSAAGERWTYTASGLVTVLASRIGALSEQSRVYVSQETHDRVRAFCESEYLGVQDFKNLSRETPVYWIKGMKQDV